MAAGGRGPEFVGALAMTRAPIAGNLGELALGFATICTYLAAARGNLRPSTTAAGRGNAA